MGVGTPEEWANDSLKLAEAAWVSDGTDLGLRYYEKQVKVVDRQVSVRWSTFTPPQRPIFTLPLTPAQSPRC